MTRRALGADGRARRPRWSAAAIALVLAVAGTLLAACGGGLAAKPLPNAQILTYEPADTTVHLRLVASETDNFNGFNFDGYADGEMRVVVPLGWTVDVSCENASSALTHSCAIVTADSFSPGGGTIAFPGATTPDPTDGLKFRQSATFTFVASKAGTYRIDCLVSGHEADGMWDWLIVRSALRPSITDSLPKGNSG